MSTPKVKQVVEIRPVLQIKLKTYASVQNKTIRAVVEEWIETLPEVEIANEKKAKVKQESEKIV